MTEDMAKIMPDMSLSEINAYWLNKLAEHEKVFVDKFLWPAFVRCKNKKEFVRLCIKWYTHKESFFKDDLFSDHYKVFSDVDARLDLFCKVDGKASCVGSTCIFIKNNKIFESCPQMDVNV